VDNLIFINESRPYYALLKTGEVVEMPIEGILEISDDRVLLEIRKSQSDFHYAQNPGTGVKPPWLADRG